MKNHFLSLILKIVTMILAVPALYNIGLGLTEGSFRDLMMLLLIVAGFIITIFLDNFRSTGEYENSLKLNSNDYNESANS